jgi:hypothetical protein
MLRVMVFVVGLGHLFSSSGSQTEGYSSDRSHLHHFAESRGFSQTRVQPHQAPEKAKALFFRIGEICDWSARVFSRDFTVPAPVGSDRDTITTSLSEILYSLA